MLGKDAMRKALLKSVDQYVRDVIPEGERARAHKILKEIREGKSAKSPVPEA